MTRGVQLEPALGGLLWRRFIFRQWRREPGLTATLLTILALGVAVFLAVRLANRAAVSGFSMFTEAISGESDLILRPASGRIPSDALSRLRKATGALPIGFFPVLETTGVIAGEEDSMLRLVGVDLVSLGNVVGGNAPNPGSTDWLDRPNSVWVGQGLAKSRGVGEGGWLDLWIGGKPATLEIAGVLVDAENRPAVPETLLLFDLPALQDLLGEPGALSRIEIRIPDGAARDEVLSEARRRLGEAAERENFVLESPEDRKASVARLSSAFRYNLTVLSGLALLVGIFLILQALEASVTKRRAEIAILRSLGVTPPQIRSAWLMESLVLGLAGGLLGILLGRLLAVGLVGGIAATVNTLYHQTTTEAVRLHWGEAIFSLGFGVIASLIAGWLPASDAAKVPPAQAMRAGSAGSGLRWLGRYPLGLAFAVVAVMATWLPPVPLSGHRFFPLGGYLAALAAVLAAAILLNGLFRPIGALLRRLGDGPMRRYAASRFARVSGRHRLTAAGLSAAIGMSAAMALLVASFEHTLTSWIQQLLKADLYVAAPGAASVVNESLIAEPDWKRIVELPGVEGADLLHRQEIEFAGRKVLLGGTSYNRDPSRRLELIWIEPPAEGELSEGLAWVSEPFSRRFQVHRGDSIEVPVPNGKKVLEVGAVYADYGNESGTILARREDTVAWFGENGVTNVALYLEPGTDPESVLARIREDFPYYVARTNGNLRSESIRIFRQTFAATYALEGIAVIVAVAGLGLALAGLFLERKNELATLRSLGATRNEIASAAMWEGTGIGLAGLLGGLIVSFYLGWILVGVINPQSFGWSLRYRVPWGGLALLAAGTLATAAIVSWWVGWRTANLRSDREE